MPFRWKSAVVLILPLETDEFIGSVSGARDVEPGNVRLAS